MRRRKGFLTLRLLVAMLAVSVVAACADRRYGGPESRAALVSEAQTLLADLGYDPGNADGLAGPHTSKAVRAYQLDHDLRGDGWIDRDLVDHMAAIRQFRLVVQAQRYLLTLGHEPGPIDGKEGPGTRAAVSAFQRAAGAAPDGAVTPALVEALAAAVARQSTAKPPPGVSVGGAAVRSAEPPRRVLDAGDRILLRYLGTRGKAAELQVRPDGRLALPRAGSVRAAGLDLKELRDRITVKLVESYMAKLEVRVDPAAGGKTDRAAAFAPGDQLLVSIQDDDPAFAKLRVAEDGRLAVPKVGQIKAAGLDSHSVEDEIAARLLESFVSKLDVSVALADAGPPAGIKE